MSYFLRVDWRIRMSWIHNLFFFYLTTYPFNVHVLVTWWVFGWILYKHADNLLSLLSRTVIAGKLFVLRNRALSRTRITLNYIHLCSYFSFALVEVRFTNYIDRRAALDRSAYFKLIWIATQLGEIVLGCDQDEIRSFGSATLFQGHFPPPFVQSTVFHIN